MLMLSELEEQVSRIQTLGLASLNHQSIVPVATALWEAARCEMNVERVRVIMTPLAQVAECAVVHSGAVRNGFSRNPLEQA